MTNENESSDQAVLNYIRRMGSVSVAELVDEMGVTATAVRQRLNRLMASDLLERETIRQPRGRPNHRYSLTAKGDRHAGTNYADLASALWEELRNVSDPQIRRGLLERIVRRLADHYKKSVEGDTIKERVASLGKLLGNRGIPVDVEETEGLPVLTALACPYPDLAEKDRGICAMEKMLFSEVVGESVRLTSCRLDGASCCTFETASV